jgi:signal transduction histidine kinase
MKEFWLWVVVVTLLIFCIMVLSFGLAYNHKQIKKADAILQRLEDKEKKREKARLDPKPDDDKSDGL